MPPSTTPGIHDDDEVEPDIGLERLRGRDQPAGDRRDADAEAERDAMGAVDVDADIGGGDRVVGGRPQRLAETHAAQEEVERDRAQPRQHEADRARLVEEDEPDLPGFTRQRRLHRQRRRAEQDQAAVREHQRNAEREDDLRVMPFGLGRDHPRARDMRDQEPVQKPTEDEHDRAGDRRRDDRAGVGSEKNQHPEAGHQVIGDVHAEHHEVALGEVHDAHDAEDDAEPDAHQAIGAADQQARRHGLEEIDDQPFELFHGSFTFPRTPGDDREAGQFAGGTPALPERAERSSCPQIRRMTAASGAGGAARGARGGRAGPYQSAKNACVHCFSPGCCVGLRLSATIGTLCRHFGSGYV